MGQSLVEAALSYAARGWPVFPLKSGAKTPLTVRGFKDASTDPASINAWWTRWPDANIGLPTGRASGVAVVDVDPRHGGDVALEQLVERHGPIPDTLECLTGGGGRHLYFRYVDGFRNSAGQIAAGIDTRGEGGYVVLPPSRTSGEYVWEGDDDARELAELPDWLVPGKLRAVSAETTSLDFDASLVTVKADGEPVAPGGRNVAAASLAGQYITAGDSLQTVMRKLDGWNRTNPEPLSTSELKRTVASVARTHASKNPAATVLVCDPPAPAEENEPTVRAPIQPFPTSLLEPPGRVGDLCKWINDTAIKPQPVLALGNVLAFYGAVIGRKVRTPTDLRTNLYCLGVGESGCGKDHSRKCIKRICEAAGLTADLLGGEEVSSDSSILTAVHSHPSILFQFDEIGHFLANVNSKYAQSHQRNIAPTFTKLFSSANTTLIGKEYANAPRKDITQPNVCLYGTTVPSRLYEGLSPGEISDGFLGRMLVFKSDDPDPHEHDVEMKSVPESIVSDVQAWRERKIVHATDNGNLAPFLELTPMTVQFEPDALAAIRKFRQACRRHKADTRGQMSLDVLWSRAVEHAWKVALIIACGCEYQTPIVSGQSAEWAIRLVEHVVTSLVNVVRDSVAGSDYERDLLFVQRVIREAGDGGVSQSQLFTRTRRLTPKLRLDIMNQLVVNGLIGKREHKPARGPVATVYYAVEG